MDIKKGSRLSIVYTNPISKICKKLISRIKKFLKKSPEKANQRYVSKKELKKQKRKEDKEYVLKINNKKHKEISDKLLKVYNNNKKELLGKG